MKKLASVWAAGRGRVKKFYAEAGTALVAFDSPTIRAMPPAYIERCEEEGYSWNEYGFELDSLDASTPRDAPSDVMAAIGDLSGQFRYAYLGEEGRAIDKILGDADLDDELEALEAWEKHLSQHLTFPFDAEVSELQERGPLRGGDRVQVHGFEMLDDRYGIIVKLRRGRSAYHFPLCDLEAVDSSSPNHDLVQLYAVWYANQ